MPSSNTIFFYQFFREVPPPKTKIDCVVKIYSNGFLLDKEEQLRRYSKDTIGFLLDLKDGVIPKEILARCNEDANIVIEHHLEETFVYAPKPFMQPQTLEQMATKSPAKYRLTYDNTQR